MTNTPILPAILSCSSTSLSDEEKYFFAKVNPVGINIFGRNIENKLQLKNLIKVIKEVIGRNNVLIAIDQEGGRVRRLREPEFRSYAAATDIASLPLNKAKNAINLHSTLIASDLTELGINVNYAPVLDIAYNNTSDALKSRCMGSDTNKISKLGKIAVDTYLKYGILPCIKHMPGHGRASVDPHLNLPILHETLEELEQDFYPFKQLNYCPLGMTAHIVISAIDNKLPVTQSPNAINSIIRNIIGFNGLLISDAIDMKALSGTAGEKALHSFKAGCDVICYALGNMKEMQEIASNCPPMSDNSLERFAKATKIFQNKQQIGDIESLSEEYNNIIGNITPYQETYDATEVLNRLQSTKGDKKC